MNNQEREEFQQALLALSVSKQHSSTISDEQLADFITDNLEPAKRQQVIDALARDPERLHEATLAYEAIMAKDAQSREASAAQASPSWWQKFNIWWASAVGSGALAAAFVVYLSFSPTQLNISEQMINSYSDSAVNPVVFKDFVFDTKSFNFGLSNEKRDFNWGVNATRVALGVDVNEIQIRECSDRADCQRREAFTVLGRWYEFNRIHCQAPNSADLPFWERQDKIIRMVSKSKPIQDTLPLSALIKDAHEHSGGGALPSDSAAQVKQSVCRIVDEVALQNF